MHGTSYLMGNVGIGTSAPKAKLDVVGTISGSALTIARSGDGDTPYLNVFANITTGYDADSAIVKINGSVFNPGGVTDALRVDVVNAGNLVRLADNGSTRVLMRPNGSMSFTGSSLQPSGLAFIDIRPNFYDFYSAPTDIVRIAPTGTLVSLDKLLRVSNLSSTDVFWLDNNANAYFSGKMGVGTGTNLNAKATIFTDDAFNNPALFIRTTETTAGQSVFKIATDVGTANTTVFNILAGGNVGIGKFTPSTKLDVVGTISGSALTIMNGNSYLLGNVGIGKTSPSTKLDVVGTMSGKSLRVTSGLFAGSGSAMVPLTVRGAVSQSANLQEWQDSTSAVVAAIAPSGRLGLGTSPSATANQWINMPNSYIYQDASEIDIRHNGLFVVANQANTIYPFIVSSAAAPTARVTVTTFAAATKGLVIVGNSGQTGNLQEWQNSSGTPLALIDASGNLGLGTSNTSVAKLSVAGTMSGRSLYISGTGATPLIATNNPTGTIMMGRTSMITGTGMMAPQLYVAGRVPTTFVGSGSTGSSPYGFFVQGRYAYVGLATDSTGFQIFDISNATKPTLLSTTTAGAIVYGIDVQGHYAYVAANNQLQIFDIANPASPVLLSTLTGGGAFDVKVRGRYAYVSDNAANVYIIDVSNPTAPVRINTITMQGASNFPERIQVRDKYLYVNVYNGTLQIYDISNPLSPSLVSNTTVGGSPFALNVEGRYAYTNGKIVDISNPASPSVISTSMGGSYYTAVQGRYFYNDSGQIYDISNPSSPTLMGQVTMSTSRGIYVQGRYLYSMNTNNSLTIFDLGGSYIQQLEAGGIQAGTVTIRGSLSAIDADIRGGLSVGQGLLVQGDSTFASGALVLNSVSRTIGIGSGTGLKARATIFTENSFNQPGLVIRSTETTGSQDIIRIVTDVSSTNNTVFRVNASGAVFSDQPYSSAGADYAEWFYSSTPDLKSGETVCIDVSKNNTVTRCTRSGDNNIMGIVSTNASFIGNSRGGVVDALGIPLPGYVLVGLIGQVPGKVMIESGAVIRAGDSLTAASIPGYTRKANAGESTVGVALEAFSGAEGAKGTINVLISRRNQSLTVEAVEQRTLEAIRNMKIEDEVQIMVSDAMENLNVSDDIRAQIEAQMAALSIEDRLAALEARMNSGSTIITQSPPSEPQPQPASLTTSGTIRAQELYASTLALDETLSVGSDARIAGDLTVDGTLNLSHLFLTGLLTIDGELNVGSTLRTNTLVVETGATLGGPVTVLSGLKVATGATFELQNGSTLRAASGAMVDLWTLIVRDALQVMGDITIHGLATFLGDIEIRGQLTVSKNQAGTVVIPRGQTSVTVTFEAPFTNKPVVTAASDAFTLWRVRNQTMSGFTIEISTVLEEDATFSWHALAVRGEESEGSEVSRSGSENVGIPFPVDQAGVPLSSNAVWNACIRNQITLDSEGNPMSCGRYHNEQDWEHPDLHITFIWNGSAEPAVLTLPEGYVATVISSDEGGTEGTEVTSSSSSSVFSESSSSLPTVAPAGAEVGESSDSSVSSESSSSSSSAETTISSSSSSSSQAPVASSSSSSVAPVVAPAPAPVTAPQDNGDGGFEGLFE
jgi:hypothetical protein